MTNKIGNLERALSFKGTRKGSKTKLDDFFWQRNYSLLSASRPSLTITNAVCMYIRSNAVGVCIYSIESEKAEQVVVTKSLTLEGN